MVPEASSTIPGQFERRKHARLGHFAPNATVFLSSAAIMVVELVAGRLIAHFLGQSLYTWTAIIGVILAGISIGNYLGGRWADRAYGRGTSAAQFVLAAGACLSVLATNEWAGAWAALVHLSWPARIAAHVTLVFLAPAIVLGTISPVIAKRALTRGRNTGGTIGNVYAWATAGSILGTMVTGFWLVVVMGTTAIIATASALLAVIGALYGAGALVARTGAVTMGSAQSAASKTQPSERASLAQWIAPAVTVFLANACIMIVEIDAGRILSRHFGQSLYTWTTIIGVVLAGMSLGSYFGGKLADRFRADRAIAALLVVSSASCLCIPFLDGRLVNTHALDVLSWPMHIFVHAMGLFFLVSVALGAVTPVVAKMALEKDRGMGKTVGIIYAWGSVGSIAGTFLAGFVLIAVVGTVRLLILVAAALAAIALVYGRRRTFPTVWAGACAVALLYSLAPWPAFVAMGQRLNFREAQNPAVVYQDESQYSYIAVVADVDKPNQREMYLDQLAHSQIDLDNPRDLKYEYEWVYSAVIDEVFGGSGAPDRPLRVMLIGGGGFVFPHYLEQTRPGSYIEVSEIDPAVTKAAQTAFGLPTDSAISIYEMDARNRVTDLIQGPDDPAPKHFISHCNLTPPPPSLNLGTGPRSLVAPLDCVIGDSFNDYAVPFHLTTREFTGMIRGLLDDGVYLLNMVDTFDSGRFLGAVVATCRTVFPFVYVFNTGRPASIRDTFIVVCATRQLELGPIPNRIRLKHDYLGGLLTQAAVDGLVQRTGGMVLTDNYAPVENLLAPVVRTRRKDLGEVYLDKARRLSARGEIDAAIRECRKAIEVHAEWPEAHETLAGFLATQGDEAGASAEWQWVVELDPAAKQAWFNLGRALAKQGRAQDAIAPLQRAAALDPPTAQPYQSLGTAWLQLGNAGAAIDAFRKAAEIDPALAVAQYNLGLALAQKDDLAQAINAWRNTLVIDPNNDDARYNLIVALDRLKRFDEAWAEIKQWRASGKEVDAALVETLKRDSGRSE